MRLRDLKSQSAIKHEKNQNHARNSGRSRQYQRYFLQSPDRPRSGRQFEKGCFSGGPLS